MCTHIYSGVLTRPATGTPCCPAPLLPHTQRPVAYECRGHHMKDKNLLLHQPQPQNWCPAPNWLSQGQALSKAGKKPELSAALSRAQPLVLPHLTGPLLLPGAARDWGHLWLAASLLPTSSPQLWLHSHPCPGLLSMPNSCDISLGDSWVGGQKGGGCSGLPTGPLPGCSLLSFAGPWSCSLLPSFLKSG